MNVKHGLLRKEEILMFLPHRATVNIPHFCRRELCRNSSTTNNFHRVL